MDKKTEKKVKKDIKGLKTRVNELENKANEGYEVQFICVDPDVYAKDVEGKETRLEWLERRSKELEYKLIDLFHKNINGWGYMLGFNNEELINEISKAESEKGEVDKEIISLKEASKEYKETRLEWLEVRSEALSDIISISLEEGIRFPVYEIGNVSAIKSPLILYQEQKDEVDKEIAEIKETQRIKDFWLNSSCGKDLAEQADKDYLYELLCSYDTDIVNKKEWVEADYMRVNSFERECKKELPTDLKEKTIAILYLLYKNELYEKLPLYAQAASQQEYIDKLKGEPESVYRSKTESLQKELAEQAEYIEELKNEINELADRDKNISECCDLQAHKIIRLEYNIEMQEKEIKSQITKILRLEAGYVFGKY